MPWFWWSVILLTSWAAMIPFSRVVALSSVRSLPYKIIDSHLHIWDDTIPSPSPANAAALLQQMQKACIDGALIVQPINYLYNHSYVHHALVEYPHRFKGMMLYDPTTMEEATAIERLEELVALGFVGVRFNPYLWPESESYERRMSQGVSLAVYRKCAQLRIPVGIMCFRGLSLHYEDILQLLEHSPGTTLILDHFAFTALKDDGPAWDQLLQLAQYPSVNVKISALFRLTEDPSMKFTQVYERRFLPLLKAYGAERLLYGSDFPYVMEIDPESAYATLCSLVASWCPDDSSRRAIMGGNAERLFGSWGTTNEDNLES
jgi:predicted TIM-barrel fold metal-dependent hydrolase